MEQIKRLYVEGVSIKDQPIRREECAFDAQCPVAGCPFKTDKPENQTASVDRNHQKKCKGEFDDSDTAASSDEEIEDDADLFVVRVGRVDPCRKDVLEHRDQGTLTDFPEESLPPPPPPPSKSKSKSTRRRSKRKSSKGKKGKSVRTRK